MLDTVRKFFFNNASSYGLFARSPVDIDIMSYAVNNHEYGMINIIVGDKCGLRYVLQRARHDYYDRLRRERLYLLKNRLEEPEFKDLNKHIIIGDDIEIEGNHYLVSRYSQFPNAYYQIRTSILSKKRQQLFAQALDFCSKLDGCGKPMDQSSFIGPLRRQAENAFNVSREIQNALDQAETECRQIYPYPTVTVVHNDLAPGNIHAGQKSYNILDWEYWSDSFSTFNYFNVLISYGAVINGRKHLKGCPDDYLSLIRMACRRRANRYLKIFADYIQKSTSFSNSPSVINALFLMFLLNKSTCQFRLYGQHYNHDLFWYEILCRVVEDKARFEKCWLHILNYPDIKVYSSSWSRKA